METSSDNMDAAKLSGARGKLEPVDAGPQEAKKMSVESLNSAAGHALNAYIIIKDLVTSEGFVESDRSEKLTSGVGHPYIVVLIDGNDFCQQLKGEYIRANGRGGTEVASRLNRELEKHLRSNPEVPQDSRLEVHIFADMKGVSFAAHQARLIDWNSQPRVLSPFVAAFNAVYPGFNIVDVANKEFTKIKVSEQFQKFVNDTDCKQIIFGVGLALTYLDAIAKSQEKGEKVILLRLGQVNPEYESLGLTMIEFPSVFRYAALSAPNFPLVSGPAIPPDRNGFLRRFDANGSTAPGRTGSYNTCSGQTGSATTMNQGNAHGLPLEASGPPDLIPLNANGARLDFFMRPPTYRERVAYDAQLSRRKLCTAHHLEDNCVRPNCEFYHGYISDTDLRCLAYMMKGIACTNGSDCRTLDCIYGHVCQKAICYDGAVGRCKMPLWAHTKDTKVNIWVNPVEGPGGDDTIQVDKVSEPQDDGNWDGPGPWSAAGAGTEIADLLGLDD